VEDWVHRALARWPNVPALYGWLSLTRRGAWCIQGEVISRPQIIDTLRANYAADERGCWYFQNGPQRGYVALEYAPLIAQRTEDDSDLLYTHTGAAIRSVQTVYLDEDGALLMATEHGAALLAEADLHWALGCLRNADGAAIQDEDLLLALQQPSGSTTALRFDYLGRSHAVLRLDYAAQPAQLGFVREPRAACSAATHVSTPLPPLPGISLTSE